MKNKTRIEDKVRDVKKAINGKSIVFKTYRKQFKDDLGDLNIKDFKAFPYKYKYQDKFYYSKKELEKAISSNL